MRYCGLPHLSHYFHCITAYRLTCFALTRNYGFPFLRFAVLAVLRCCGFAHHRNLLSLFLNYRFACIVLSRIYGLPLFRFCALPFRRVCTFPSLCYCGLPHTFGELVDLNLAITAFPHCRVCVSPALLSTGLPFLLFYGLPQDKYNGCTFELINFRCFNICNIIQSTTFARHRYCDWLNDNKLPE